MKLLLTSDWQTEFSNLPECEQSLQELLDAADSYKPDAIIHAGDLKQDYNPIDLRIVKFWVRAVRKITEGYRFVILRGNHDRISQDVNSKDWLDVLRAAGAETVSQPKTKQIGDGTVGFLPFTPDKTQEIEWAKRLAGHKRDIGPRVLVFHTEIRGAYMTASKMGEGNTAQDLLFDSWDTCLGGHLHCFQKLTDCRAWYIGSPFCMDWGEADQVKGHVLYDSRAKDAVPKQLRTSIPGWYNAGYLAENDITPEPGAYIRQRVPVTSKNITAALKDEESRLSKLYENSRIFVIPKLQTVEAGEVVLTGNSDKSHVEQYIAATMPEAANFDSVVGVAYFLKCLSAIDPGARCSKVRVLRLVGSNVLSFKKVEVNYHNQGLVLLKGRNLDWPKRSNGAGKTNILSLLPAAWFGETLKNQKNDSLVNELFPGPATFELTVRNGKGQKVKITRGRRPHVVRMSVDGKDVSTGLTGKRKNETQGQIEDVLGFDFNLLINSVYIDQTIANGFVFGTQKYRMDLVNKLLNLQRYEDALAVVKKDIDVNAEARVHVTNNVSNLEVKRDNIDADIIELKKQEEHNWDVQLQEQRKEVNRLLQASAAVAGSEKHYKEVEREYDDLHADAQATQVKIAALDVECRTMGLQLERCNALIKAGACGYCGRKTADTTKATVEQVFKDLTELSARREIARKEYRSIVKLADALETQLSAYKALVRASQQELQQAKAVHAKIQQAADDEADRNSKIISRIKKYETELAVVKKQIKLQRKELRSLEQEQELLEYAKKAFQRSGLPMYLASGLCPLLNRAAEEYSEIFNGGKLQVVFEVADGDFSPKIINAAGSKTSEGQSVGESAMAGIIAAFALREAAPKTNLVILDEPGHGLDAEGAKQFAMGLLQLKGRWPTLIVTTHSPIIEGILAGETTWVVEKKDGVSQFIDGGKE